MSRPTTAVRTTAILVGAAYTAAIYLSGVHLDTGAKKVLAYVPLGASLLLAIWDVALWRVPIVHRFLSRPRLDGTWVATLMPTDESHIPEGGKRGPIPAYVIITQTYWGLGIRQYTEESKSDLKAHFWVPASSNGPDTLVFTYENLPKQKVQHRSGRHYGTCQLDPTVRDPEEMTGYYFTDRYTKGDMTLRRFDRSTGHASFEATAQHCGA